MNGLEDYLHNKTATELQSSRLVAADYFTNLTAYKNPNANHWTQMNRLLIGVSDWRSRLGEFKNPWGASCKSEYLPPAFTFTNLSFSDVADQRAIELFSIAKATNRRILILWSGGIDSTAVLSSFIKNLEPADRDILTITLSSRSILENSHFYVNHISNKLDCLHYSNFDLTPELLKKYIVIHGDPGDCLQGPSIPAYAKFIQQGTHKDPWRNHISGIIDSVQPHPSHPHYSEGFGKWFVNAVSANLEEINPENVITVADWWWWTYYNFKWEFSCQRPFFFSRSDFNTSFTKEELVDYATNTYFNSPNWQQWSYSNLQTLLPAGTGWDVRKMHKHDARSYIFELDRNDLYFETKVKTPGAPANVLDRQSRVQPVYFTDSWQGRNLSDPGVRESVVQLLEDFN
jgi:hypothetical protein